MSDTIVCHGCGVAVPVPDDYARNKMQCPECGVMCPVPPRPPAKKKAVKSAPAEDAALFEDDAPGRADCAADRLFRGADPRRQGRGILPSLRRSGPHP